MPVSNILNIVNQLRCDDYLEKLTLDIPLCRMARTRNIENIKYFLEVDKMDGHKINAVLPFYIRAPEAYRNTSLVEVELLLVHQLQKNSELKQCIENNKENKQAILNPLFSRLGVSCLKFKNYDFFMLELA
ncbi:hypothetical protein [Lactiplantibacillus plantarum]|uniref:hypothetical protein n=1 Tax=Lactiplantibacillus plantarum TaxID=1590 RepID=UPI001BA44B6A|nr:hypothetical protein [Lactiplantibacillus plantarum]MBS0954984.1 hypothetical protein [Lactiplantibacillus plantarum]